MSLLSTVWIIRVSSLRDRLSLRLLQIAGKSPHAFMHAAYFVLCTELSSIFNGDTSQIDWSNFSPDALGMQLKFDEMSTEELEKVVAAFVRLGLISPEESEAFAASLVDPRMRNMLQQVSDNWPETMQRVLKDPAYRDFLKNLEDSLDEDALANIVGLKDGLQGALKNGEQ